MKKKKRYLTKIDHLLAEMPTEGVSEFKKFTSVGRRLIDIQAWWRERGINLSLTAVSNWVENQEIESEYGKLANAIAEKFKGTKGLAALEATVAMAMIAADSQFNKAFPKDNEGTDKDKWLLLSALKELRSASVAFNNAVVRGDRMEDILSGAYELVRKAATAAKDHPNEQWLVEVLDGEVKALEEEMKREQVGDVNG